MTEIAKVEIVDNNILAPFDKVEAAVNEIVENKKHQAKINNEVLNVFIEYGMDKDKAKSLVTDISKNLFPSITINY